MNRPGWLLLLALVLLGGSLRAVAAEPLYRQSPFDEIKLDEANSGTVLKVKPLDFLERKVPPPAKRTGELEVELLERPGEKFALPWANVVEIRLFEERVLAEAEQQVTVGNFDEAQAGLRFLEQHYPQVPRLGEVIENFLWLQIAGAFRAGKLDETLALLVELHRRNPQRPGLATAYERTTIELVKSKLAAKNYRAARGLLTNLVRRFPETGRPAAAPYVAQLQSQAAEVLGQAKQAAAQEKWSEANTLCLQALEVWPAIEGGTALAQQIHNRYPTVTVGVIGSPAPGGTPPVGNPLTDWHARRLGRLVATPLVELVSQDLTFVYRSPYGKLVPQSDARQYLVRLASSNLSASDLARQLKPTGPAAATIRDVRARGLTDLLFEFHQPQLRPAAWLQLAVTDSTTGASPLPWGQFIAEPSSPEKAIFRRRPEVPASPTAPQLVHEHRFAEATPALAALRRGQINVLERIPLWELPRLKNVSDVRVLSYAIPTVHLLIPNANKRLLANRSFRRGLLVALDRHSILQQGLLSEQTIAGCEVLSGPFPAGPDRLPWAYASDPRIAPRPYEPGLAAMLLEVGRVESGLPASAAPLVLAHDDQPMSKIACQSIARQLARVGQPITLQQVTPGQTVNADLHYVELAIHEPMVDAWALLGPGGLAGPCSPLMLEYFRELERATDLNAASAKLQEIHRLAAAELPAIPLWQTTNFAAVHATLQGIADSPVCLYEDVLNWQVAWQPPAE
jgi:tetratricopeptide (TPR) repeat protein